MNFNNNKHVPLYVQIKEYFIEKMSNGTYVAGDKLPAEELLAEQFVVSRMTVNKAFRDLAHSGYIVRKPGIGSFVTAKRYENTSDNLLGFADYMKSRNLNTHSTVLAQVLTSPTKEVATLLNISKNTPVYKIERLRHTNTDPLVLQISWVIADYCPDLLQADFSQESIYQKIFDKTGKHVTIAKDRIEAISCPHRMSPLLEVPVGFPLLYIVRKSFFENNEPIELSYSWYRSDRYVLNVDYN